MMMTRMTTNGVLKGYKSSLAKSFKHLNNARNTVLTQRNFNSYAEDPAAATQAFQLRRAFWRADSQLTNSQSVVNKFESAYSTMDQVAKDVKNALSDSANAEVLRLLNQPTGSGRQALGTALTQLSDSLTQSMNVKYADNFIFAGADGLNVPFSWEEDKLCYRGIPVDTEIPGSDYQPTSFDYYYYAGDGTPTYPEQSSFYPDLNLPDGVSPTKVTVTINKTGITSTGGTPATDDKQFRAFFAQQKDLHPELELDPATANITDLTNQYVSTRENAVQEAEVNLKKLKYLTGETNYVDLGFGLQEDQDGNLIQSSAFNVSLPGINYLGGYGVDEDGDPKNIISLVRRLGTLASNCDPDTGEWATPAEGDEACRLQLKLAAASDNFTNQYVQLSTKAGFVKENSEQLEDTAYTLAEQINSIEQCDMADAITAFSWAQYSYNAALKVGNSILSESLMDYINT